VYFDWPGDEVDVEEIADDGGNRPIEGITTYQVGFQRVPVVELYPSCWSDLDEMPWEYYFRPPALTYSSD
jgi:hypothetical protein